MIRCESIKVLSGWLVSVSTYKLFLLILAGSALSFADVDTSLIGSFDSGGPVYWNFRNAPEPTGTTPGESSTPGDLGTFTFPSPPGGDPFHGDASILLLSEFVPSNVRNGDLDPSGSGPTDPGSGPTDPGTGPTDPGTGPTDPGTGPTDPGTGGPGDGPNPPRNGDPGTGPTDPGSGPTDPGSGPTDPGGGPTDPPVVVAEPFSVVLLGTAILAVVVIRRRLVSPV